MRDITREVASIIEKSSVQQGTVLIYCPHTTAGIAINENADPDVRHVIIHDRKLLLGRWQGIYFCEFDGPRRRQYHVKIMEG
jgi:thiamine phosphate synthase YjbQ (UPF0047 family)